MHETLRCLNHALEHAVALAETSAVETAEPGRSVEGAELTILSVLKLRMPEAERAFLARTLAEGWFTLLSHTHAADGPTDSLAHRQKVS